MRQALFFLDKEGWFPFSLCSAHCPTDLITAHYNLEVFLCCFSVVMFFFLLIQFIEHKSHSIFQVNLVLFVCPTLKRKGFVSWELWELNRLVDWLPQRFFVIWRHWCDRVMDFTRTICNQSCCPPNIKVGSLFHVSKCPRAGHWIPHAPVCSSVCFCRAKTLDIEWMGAEFTNQQTKKKKSRLVQFTQRSSKLLLPNVKSCCKLQVQTRLINTHTQNTPYIRLMGICRT